MTHQANIQVNPIESVLFDLDGTLLDSAPDLGGALNAILVNHNRSPLPMELVRTHVSRGAMALVKLGFGHDADDPRARPLWQELIDHYENHLADETVIFPGVLPLLDRIESSGMNWGIVTNKPDFLTHPLLKLMKLDYRAGCVVGGDTLPQKKPHPAPILFACEQLGCPPGNAIYIGDDRRDIDAGNRAGMPTLAARWGYILADDDPSTWGANGLIDHPQDIYEWIF